VFQKYWELREIECQEKIDTRETNRVKIECKQQDSDDRRLNAEVRP